MRATHGPVLGGSGQTVPEERTIRDQNRVFARGDFSRSVPVGTGEVVGHEDLQLTYGDPEFQEDCDDFEQVPEKG